MNYKKLYFDYIKYIKTLGRIKRGNLEVHHIIPPSIGGSGKNNEWKYHPNLVLLTPREHFIAHLFLQKIYNDPEVKETFKKMSKNYTLNSKGYEKLLNKRKKTYQWYNNGLENIKVYNKKVPDGFIKGFILLEETKKIKKVKKEIKERDINLEKEHLKDLKKISKDKAKYEKIIIDLKQKVKRFENRLINRYDLNDISKYLNSLVISQNFNDENKIFNSIKFKEFDDKHPINYVLSLLIMEFMFLRQIKRFPSTIDSLRIFYEQNPELKNPNRFYLKLIYNNTDLIVKHFGERFLPLFIQDVS